HGPHSAWLLFSPGSSERPVPIGAHTGGKQSVNANSSKIASWATTTLAAVLLVAATPIAASAASPDFSTVHWVALQCDDANVPSGNSSPASTDLVGDATFPSIQFSYDASYLYFRYRVDRNPAGPQGFDQYAWVALMHTPTGNP